MKKFNYLIFLLALVAFLGSCKDDESDSITPDFTTNITASVGGIILDENGDGVSRATVSLGTTEVVTNPFGVFLFNGVQMDADRAYLKVNKAGYFLGSRTIKPNTAAVSNVRIKLLRKTSAGSFTSSAGGTITSTDGVELVFTPNSIIVEGGGAYSGTVDVAIQFLDPNAADMFDIMPGDLKGIDLDGQEMGLQTLGMAAIELSGSGGQKLNLASGSTASLTMPLSSTLSNPPATIPLWCFDEEQGIWKEEGTATLENNAYVGEVSHFSFWNCDVAFAPAYISGQVTCNGVPRQGVYVTARIGNGNFARAITSADGTFEGYGPDNEVLTLEVASISCGTVLHTETVGPFSSSSNTVIPTLDACGSSSASGTSHIMGLLVDCDNNPVINGGLRVFDGQTSSFFFSDASGNINISAENCGQDSFTFWAFDYDSELVGLPKTIAAGATTDIGDLSTCGEEIFYMDVVYNGEPTRTYILGSENEVAVAYYHGNGRTYIWGGEGVVGQEERGLYLYINGQGVGTFDVDTVIAQFSPTNYGISLGPVTGVTVTITEQTPTLIDPDFDRIKGTFTGTFTDDEDGQPRTVSGSFNVPIAE